MMKKRILSALLASACLASSGIVSISASAEKTTPGTTPGDLKYVLVDEDEDGKLDFARITGCSTSVESILIPKTIDDFAVQEIKSDAFSKCTSLMDISVSSENNYFSAEGGVLFNKKKTALIAYPQAKKTSETYAIPTGVTEIGDNAFVGSTILTNITIPSSVTTIGDNSFAGCTGLGSIKIPASVKSVGTNAFSGTKLLTDQFINKQGPIYYADTWVIASDSDITTVMNDSSSIKSGTTGIAGGSFTGHTSLLKADIPATVLYIGKGAFANCKSLSSVTIPSSVTLIEESAFEGCSAIVDISLPDKVKTISKAAFRNCTNLSKVNIPTSISTLSESVFEGCSALVSADIPDNVRTIEKLAFYNCKKLTKVTIRNKNCKIEDKPQTISNSNTSYDGVIEGASGSTAEKYANTQNRTFKLIGSDNSDPSGSLKGDANGDGKVNVRDAAFIASQLAQGKGSVLPLSADFNGDSKVNVRDAAAIATALATGKL